jgi:Tol biopolymer transport system component
MDHPPPAGEPRRDKAHERLDSWKAIAAYLKRDVSTVQRWERREAMPVHRHLHAKQGSVYAYRSELDAWWERRCVAIGQEESAATDAQVAVTATATPVSEPLLHRPAWITTSLLIALLGAAGAVYLISTHHARGQIDPLIDARTTELTIPFDKAEAAAISRDGRFVAFLASADGRMDAYITEVGTGQYRNLTQGGVSELSNPSVRPLGFSPDGNLVTVWSRASDGSKPGDVNILAAPRQGGPLRPFLPDAAEVAWSNDGSRLAFHTTAPGDPIFIRNSDESRARQIYVAPAGVHCHFPLWSWDDEFIYFVRGVPPDDWDIWRIRASGENLKRITVHQALVSHPVLLDRHTLGYLASDSQQSGPWLFAVDADGGVSHRIGPGLERYTSLAASADGARLVATVSRSHSSLSQLSVDDALAREVPLLSYGMWPRLGPDFLLYVSSSGGRQSIFKRANGSTQELWSTNDPVGVLGGLSVAPGGREVAFTVTDAKKTTLRVMDSAGRQVRTLSARLALRGSSAWTADGKSLVAGVLQEGVPHLMRIPLDGTAPVNLVAEYSLDPVWSPDGKFLLYSGPDVGTTFPVRAVAPDGRPYPLGPLILSRGARRMAFWRDGHSLVLLRGDLNRKRLSLVDLQSGAERALGPPSSEGVIEDFDVSPRADEIVLARVRETSEIALIERSATASP